MNLGTTARTILIAGAVTLAACGGDDVATIEADATASVGADTPVGRAIAADILGEDDAMTTSEEEARCVAGRIVDGVGEDRLAELGITAESVGDIQAVDFTDGEIDTVVSAMFDCVDLKSNLAQQMAGEVGEDAAQCFADELDEDFVKQMFRSDFSEGDDLAAATQFFEQLAKIAEECDIPLE